MSITIVGNAVLDVIFTRVPRIPAWPRHTEFTRTNLVQLPDPPLVTLGGNGANAAFVAARCGAEVTLHSPVGDDAPGILIRGWLHKSGCTLRAALHGARAGATRTAVNVTAANRRHRRATFFHPGVAPRLPARVTSDILLVCGWPHPPLPELATCFRAARDRGTFTALDLGPILQRPWSLAALQPVGEALSLLIANEHELLKVTRATTVPAALARLRRFFAGPVVIKCGRRGALWLPSGETQPREMPAPRVAAVNTVGAGDAFNGALLAALDRGRPFAAAIAFANRTAARAVSSPHGVLGLAAI